MRDSIAIPSLPSSSLEESEDEITIDDNDIMLFRDEESMDEIHDEIDNQQINNSSRRMDKVSLLADG